MDLLDGWLSGDQKGSTLVLLSDDEANAGLSFRNLRRVDVMPVADSGVADIIGAGTLLVSDTALDQLVARATAAGETAETAETAETEAA